MRIWSLHPQYLDTKGLAAVWRETLLAKYVLEGKTRGYRHHPQLERFSRSENPTDALNEYLTYVFAEAVRRNYNFDRDKINWSYKKSIITVTTGQMKYETEHLLNKLRTRDPERYIKLLNSDTFQPNPIFKIVEGDIESWERTKF